MNPLDAIGRILDAIARALPLVLAWLAGRAGAKGAAAERAAETKDQQLEIAANPPASRDDLLERMRRNGL